MSNKDSSQKAQRINFRRTFENVAFDCQGDIDVYA